MGLDIWLGDWLLMCPFRPMAKGTDKINFYLFRWKLVLLDVMNMINLPISLLKFSYSSQPICPLVPFSAHMLEVDLIPFKLVSYYCFGYVDTFYQLGICRFSLTSHK